MYLKSLKLRFESRNVIAIVRKISSYEEFFLSKVKKLRIADDI